MTSIAMSATTTPTLRERLGTVLGLLNLYRLVVPSVLVALTLLASRPQLLGAAAPALYFSTLVAWFVVAPLKGQPVAAGFVPTRMAIGPIVNGAWGLGAGIALLPFARWRHRVAAER